jgi:membrane protease YdiL (CAAX protease family)
VWACFFALIAMTVAATVVYLAAAEVLGRSQGLALAVSVPIQAYGTFLVARRISRRYGTGHVSDDLGWRVGWRDVLPGLGTAVLALVLTGIAVQVVRTALGIDQAPDDALGPLYDTPSARLLLFAGAVVAAPVFEELLFRGVVLHSMLRWGVAKAVVVSSLLFGSIHIVAGLQSGNPLLVLTSTATTGAVLAVVALRTGRLGPSIIGHGTFNLVVLLAALASS